MGSFNRAQCSDSQGARNVFCAGAMEEVSIIVLREPYDPQVIPSGAVLKVI